MCVIDIEGLIYLGRENMRNIIVILKSVISPLFVVFLCLAGVVSSAISLVIEYFTLQPLFGNDNIEILWNIDIALFITLIFEVLKNGCCVLFPGLETHKPKLYSKARAIWCCLMLFSLLCTMIYTTNTLFKGIVMEEQERVETTIDQNTEDINKLYKVIENKQVLLEKKEGELEDITNTYYSELTKLEKEYGSNEKKTEYINSYTQNARLEVENAYNAWLIASENAANPDNIHFTDESHYINYGKSRLEEASANYEKANERLSATQREAGEQYKKDWDDAKESLNNTYEEKKTHKAGEINTLSKEIQSMETQLEVLEAQTFEATYAGKDEKYNSKYIETLNVFLLYWTHLISPKVSGYERFYLIVIFSFSTIVSVMLEYIIYFTNQIIGQPINILWGMLVSEDDNLKQSHAELVKKCEDILLILIKASLCSAAYLLLYVLSALIQKSDTITWQHNIRILLIMAGIYFIVYYIFGKTTLPEGTLKPQEYIPEENMPRLIKNISMKIVPAIRKRKIDILNAIPKWVWNIFLFLVMVTISMCFFPDTVFETKDDFLWAFGRSVIVGIFGLPLNNLSKK